MTGPIRVLHLEDDPRDAELLHDRLKSAGVWADIKLVTGKEDFEAAVRREVFDLILSDYNLPGYSGIAAVTFVREHRPETPVIVVSGTVGEEEAVKCLQLGATDYLIKMRLERLVPAVKRAIQDAAGHRMRMEAEKAVQQRERWLHSIYETVADALFYVEVEDDGGYRFTSVNRAFFSITGLAFRQVIGERVEEVLSEPSLSLTLQKFGEAIQDQKIVRWEDTTGDTQAMWTVSASVAPVCDEAGKCTHLVGAMHDITERRRTAEALRGSEERLRLAQGAADIGVWDWDLRSGQVQWTPELARLYGLEPGSVRSHQDWYQRVHPDDVARVEAERDAAIAQQRSFEMEFRIVHGSGESRWIYAKGGAIYDEAGTALRVLGVNVDVTRRKQLEAQLLQAQKVESVGRLAGGIAHDFNNLLTVINTTAELAAMELRQDDPLRQDLAEIRSAGARGAALTHQLLAFSRKQVLQPRVVNLTTLVTGLHPLLQRLIGEDVPIPVALAEDLANVRVDPSQLEQVIVNLAVNARDAMPDGGTLTIETRNVELDEGYSSLHPTVQPGRFVLLAVSDTGVGMDETTRQRMFEPFFTTKPLGKGTGLGLATVYGIVKQSGGSIWVYSEVGKGTTFKIYLPVADVAVEQVPKPTRVEARGTETILLVEDEEGMRRVAKRVLERAGYAVLVAANGEEALRLLEGHEGRLELLLTDVVMPGMSGPALAERLKVSHADTKVLYMSGYTDEAIVHHGVLDEGVQLLGKPYTVADLTHKVREVLDS